MSGSGSWGGYRGHGERGGGRGGRGGRGRGDGERGRGGGDFRGGGYHGGDGFRGSDRGRGGRGDRGRGDRGGGGRGRGGPPKQVFLSEEATPQEHQGARSVEDKYEAGLKDSLGLDSLSLARNFPLRPSYGNNGQPVLLRTNYFEMAVDGDLGLNRYKVDVHAGPSGNPPKGRMLKQIIRLLLEQHFNGRQGKVATDYKSILLCRDALQTDEDTVYKVEYRSEDEDEAPADPKIHQVRVQHTGNLSAAALLQYLASVSAGTPLQAQEEIVQAMNIIVGHYPKSQSNIMTVGANKHYPTNNTNENFNLYGGLEALRGYFVSVRAATARLLVNVQVKHAACYRAGPLPRMVTEYGEGPQRLNKFLKRVRVRLTHLKKKNKPGPVKTINGLATPRDGQGEDHPPRVARFGAGPKEVQFYVEGTSNPPTSTGSKKKGKGKDPPPPQQGSDGQYISVYDHFLRTYNVQTDPNMPVVNYGSIEKPRYLPTEVCEVVPGQPCNSKLSSGQTSRMIEFAVRTPAANAQSIVNDGTKVIGAPQNAMLTNMGLAITPKMITVPGRVLPGPIVFYGTNPLKQIQGGSWNLAGLKGMTRSVKIPDFVVLHLYERPQLKVDTANHVSAFTNFLGGYGMSGGSRRATVQYQVFPKSANIDDQIDQAFGQAISSGNPRLLFVILPEVNTPIYNRIKYNGDIRYGVHTICVVGSKFLKDRNVPYWGNLVPKLNLKLGGINQTLQDNDLDIIGQGKTMVVGIDVTHPSPGSAKAAPSIAGMVASVNKNMGQFPSIIRMQRQARNEMVDDLQEMLESRLRLWSRHNNKNLPQNILVYRDGVSEGQYGLVVEKELPSLRKACENFYPAKDTQNGLPKISIVVVGKRHHTRFYPTKLEDADSQSNPKSGTVVDRGVTETRNWDFYLQAHSALKGTARPAHYFVILDEIFRHDKQQKSGTPANRLENLTHRMCYLFGRATKAVSVCPPAYYADLVCERARCYLSSYYDASPTESVVSGQTSAGPQQSEIAIHERLADTMFYT